MCLICIEFEKQRMSLMEARRALGEMKADIGSEHAEEVRRMLDEAETKRQQNKTED